MPPQTCTKTGVQSELASAIQTRGLLGKHRNRLLNRYHAPHNRQGTKLNKESLSSRRRLMALNIRRYSNLEQVELRATPNHDLSPTTAITEMDREIEQVAKTMDDYGSLVGIKGIGPRAAATLKKPLYLEELRKRQTTAGIRPGYTIIT